MSQYDDDSLFASMSGGADHNGFQFEIGAGHSRFGDGDEQSVSISNELPTTVFFPPIDLTPDDLPEGRRQRLAPSVHSDNSDSYILSARGGHRGGPDSVLSSAHDGMTKSSRTETSSQAQREMDAAAGGGALLDDIDEVPDIVTVEPTAASNIGAADHWNQMGLTPRTTGLQASSNSAMAAAARALSASQSPALASQGIVSAPHEMVSAPQDTASSVGTGTARSTTTGSARSTRANAASSDSGAAEVVARLPCEFARYKGCQETFPLYRSGEGVEEWTDHMVRTQTHLNYQYPERSGCWFCDEKFRVNEHDSRAAQIDMYNKRMRHIARHYLEEGPQATAAPRLDADFEAHLIAYGIWDNVPADQANDDGDAVARVPSANHVRPMHIETQPGRTPRSAWSNVSLVTERAPRANRNGTREPPRQVLHRQ
ncbi:hypothetical protein LEL_03309 [Akanthomyces lecanii RCEF 1005]|uniref:Uncharacterized protein n=1 Tax=Akanthomyces lecanii RCEF 1005 TaxID=1081108 RepID=A0A168IYW7_CORDF|nr:hypothetical protein LEL_03309 [Akanthomyces lecanii RCEF 1005]